MDKELKETVKSLVKSDKAMQAEISMVKCELIRSDYGNSPAGSQRSDLVPSILPAAKRRKTKSEGDDFEPITDDKAEEEDDKNGKLESQQNLYNCQTRLGLLLRQHLCQS